MISSPFKGYREKSHVSGTQKVTREQGAGKRRGSTSFPPPLTASTLAWATRFLSIRPHSIFNEPVYVRNPEKKFELFTY